MADVLRYALVHIKVYEPGSIGELSSLMTVFYCVAMLNLNYEASAGRKQKVLRRIAQTGLFVWCHL